MVNDYCLQVKMKNSGIYEKNNKNCKIYSNGTMKVKISDNYSENRIYPLFMYTFKWIYIYDL